MMVKLTRKLGEHMTTKKPVISMREVGTALDETSSLSLIFFVCSVSVFFLFVIVFLQLLFVTTVRVFSSDYLIFSMHNLRSKSFLV